MHDHQALARRDPRFDLSPGSAVVEFADPGASHARVSAELAKISAAGVCFETGEWGADIPLGAVLVDVVVRVGDRSLQGEIQVLNVKPRAGGGLVFGGLFCPASPEVEDVLMALLESIEAVVGTGTGTDTGNGL